ncbi:hypothetical protein [Streptomyces sp. NPDC055060]
MAAKGDPESGDETTQSGETVNISSHTGGWAIGDHSTSVTSYQSGAWSQNEIEQLLRAAHELRADLARLAAGEHTARLDEELAEAVRELERTGHADVARWARLRIILAESAATGALASAMALDHVIRMALDGPGASTFYIQPASPASSGTPRPAPDPSGHTSPGPSTGSDDDEWPE